MPTFEKILEAQGTNLETVIRGLETESFAGANLDPKRQAVLLKNLQPLFDNNFGGMAAIPAPAGILLFCQQHAGDESIGSQAKVLQALITKKIFPSKSRRPAQEAHIEVLAAPDDSAKRNAVETPPPPETPPQPDKQAAIAEILEADLAEGYAANDKKLKRHLAEGHATNLRVLQQEREEGQAALDVELEARRARMEALVPSDERAAVLQILRRELTEGQDANRGILESELERRRAEQDARFVARGKGLEAEQDEALARRRTEAEEDLDEFISFRLIRELTAVDRRVEAKVAALLDVELEKGRAGIAQIVAQETDAARDLAIAEMRADVAREGEQILRSFAALAAAVESGRASLTGGLEALFAEFSQTLLRATEEIAVEIADAAPDADDGRNDGLEDAARDGDPRDEDGTDDADASAAATTHVDKGSLSEAGSEVAGRAPPADPEVSGGTGAEIVNIFEAVYIEKGLSERRINARREQDTETSRLLKIEGIGSFPALLDRSKTGPYILSKAAHAALVKTTDALRINDQVHKNRFKAAPSNNGRHAVASVLPTATLGSDDARQGAAADMRAVGAALTPPLRAPKPAAAAKSEYRNFNEVALDELNTAERPTLVRYMAHLAKEGITAQNIEATKGDAIAVVNTKMDARGRLKKSGERPSARILVRLGVLKGATGSYNLRPEFIARFKETADWAANQAVPTAKPLRATNDFVLRSERLVDPA